MTDAPHQIPSKNSYSRKWVVGTTAGLLLVGVAAAGWMFSVASRLPDPLASHWNSKGVVDGHSSLLDMAVSTILLGAAIGAVISLCAIMLRAQSTMLARIGLGFGVGLGLLLMGLFTATVAGQIDQVGTEAVKLSGPVMAGGISAAVVAGTACFLAYRPQETVRTQSLAAREADAAANDPDSAVYRQQAQVASAGGIMETKLTVRHARLAAVLLGTVSLAASWYFDVFYVMLSTLVFMAVSWLFMAGTFVADQAGIRFMAGGFWKRMPLQYSEMKSVHVQDITALDYGGWGYRMNISDVGFISGDGPAVVIDRGYYQQQIISFPDWDQAEHAGALINAYRAKSSRQ